MDERRIDLVSDDPVFHEPAPGTAVETFSASAAEEGLGGHFSPGQVSATHVGAADLAAARWWFSRLVETGWTLTTIGGVHCDHGSYALSATKNFDDGDAVFLASIIVILKERRVTLSAQTSAAEMESPGGGDVGDGIELSDTCLGGG